MIHWDDIRTCADAGTSVESFLRKRVRKRQPIEVYSAMNECGKATQIEKYMKRACRLVRHYRTYYHRLIRLVNLPSAATTLYDSFPPALPFRIWTWISCSLS